MQRLSGGSASGMWRHRNAASVIERKVWEVELGRGSGLNGGPLGHRHLAMS